MVKNIYKGGVIKDSATPWLSPVVLAMKKDGSTRSCVDYRKLNKVTKKEKKKSYQLSHIDLKPFGRFPVILNQQ